MINVNNNRALKAVGLMSGGLDSTLAAKIIKDLGMEVYGVYFSMPWGCCDKTMAIEAAQEIGIKFITLQLDERYLNIVENAKHGYGSALNPCVDCRIHMFSRAAKYMEHIGADFVFTGEVLGQRPMSQLKNSMRRIEKNAGLEGKLLRPLSAQLLEPTEMEKSGLIDRSKLLRLVGRSRRDQYKLAEEFNISSYNQPAGGCLLTDKQFANRMKDVFKYGYRDFRETIALQWGKHFRVNDRYKIILGRDKDENKALTHYADIDDIIMELADYEAATLILKGADPSEELLAMAAGLIQRFSKYKNDKPLKAIYWKANKRNDLKSIIAKPLEEEIIEEMKI